MKIYLAGSITGGTGFGKEYAALSAFLQTKGTVLTEHLAKETITEQGEKLEAGFIFNRDTKWIRECDILVAEVSTPSFGVGYEIGLAEKLDKKIICLYNTNSAKKLSAMISGNPKIKTVRYSSIEEAEKGLERFFA